MREPFYHLPEQLPVVWTSPTSVQVGVDPPLARINNVPDTAAPLIHAVSMGTLASGLRMIARDHRVSEEWLEHFVGALSQVFSLPPASNPPRWSLWSTSDAVSGLLPLAHHSGIRLTVAPDGPDVPDTSTPPADGVIIVADYLIHPHWLNLLAHHKLPHCPVVFSDQAVTVGPRVIEGESPCLVCVESHHRDHTPQWLEVASQLWGRVSPLHRPAVHGMAWMLVMTLMTPALDPSMIRPGTRATFRPGTGQTLWEEVTFHPQCMCRGPADS